MAAAQQLYRPPFALGITSWAPRPYTKSACVHRQRTGLVGAEPNYPVPLATVSDGRATTAVIANQLSATTQAAHNQQPLPTVSDGRHTESFCRRIANADLDAGASR